MNRQRKLSRRSFVSIVTGGVIATGLGGRSALALQVNDSDRHISDPPGRGQGQRSGLTDQDPSDAVGNGRGGVRGRGTGVEPQRPPQQPFRDNERERGTGVTDTDPSDRPGYGRAVPRAAPDQPFEEEPRERSRGSGITDSDPTDQVGRGRGGTVRRCSDSDSGSGADPGQQGRRC